MCCIPWVNLVIIWLFDITMTSCGYWKYIALLWDNVIQVINQDIEHMDILPTSSIYLILNKRKGYSYLILCNSFTMYAQSQSNIVWVLRKK